MPCRLVNAMVKHNRTVDSVAIETSNVTIEPQSAPD
jgi:hypothetical protein